MKWLEKYADYAYALLRIVTGFMFLFHGAQKILGVLSGFQPRAAAFLCSGTMAVAYIQYHWKFQIGSQLFPALNKGELALLYSLVFLLIACRGGIKWSLDKTK